MKRFGFFTLWTLGFWLFALLLGGRIAAVAETYSRALDRSGEQPRNFREGMEKGFHEGVGARKKVFEFWRRYWHVTLAGAIVVAGVGSAKGVLPGTRKVKKFVEPPPLPPPPL